MEAFIYFSLMLSVLFVFINAWVNYELKGKELRKMDDGIRFFNEQKNHAENMILCALTYEELNYAIAYKELVEARLSEYIAECKKTPKQMKHKKKSFIEKVRNWMKGIIKI